MRHFLARLLLPVIQRLSLVVSGWKPETRVTDEDPWGGLLSGGGPIDRPWHQVAQDLTDVLEAWRENFLIRQIVRLTTCYVVGDGIRVSSSHPWVGPFVTAFWTHRQNKIAGRLGAWCDELTRAGELFIALFTNPVDGMSYVRAVPASQIVKVEVDPDDYERETGYLEQVVGQIQPKRWASMLTPPQSPPGGGDVWPPVLLHYVIGKPVGATRGEGDLTPVLPWASRYVEWLKEQVQKAKTRNDLACAEVIVDDDSQVKTLREQYKTDPPTRGGIFVHGKGIQLNFPSAKLEAQDASADGKALRLAVAAGANLSLVHFGEGDTANRSTTASMDDRTYRHYRMRQGDFAAILVDLCEQAFRRRAAVLGQVNVPVDMGIVAECPDVSREDNKVLAESAKLVVEAFAIMKTNGWIDDETAIRLSFRFAGEILPEEKIKEILNG